METKLWVTICDAEGRIVTYEICSKNMTCEEEARRAIIHSVMEGGGHVLKIEVAGVRLE